MNLMWRALICLILAPIVTCLQPTCPMIRYTGNFDVKNHVQDHALFGSSYKNLTTDRIQQCFGICVQDCRCVSYQLHGKQCELIDENRHTTLADRFKPTPGYMYFELTQEFKNKGSGCSSRCNNGCCRFSPCQNGGTCIELCDNVTRKFECKCPSGYSGRVCDVPVSCNAYSKRSSANVYPIYTSITFIDVYCDMTSEPGMVWTLLESFALSNNQKYMSTPLSQNFPVNEKNINWADYRLPLSVMQHIQSHATHWRATCNYEKDGLIKTDFIKGSIQVFDVLKNYDNGCFRVDYANVRDISCTDCTINMRQFSDRHVNVDSYMGTSLKCDLQLNTATSKLIENNYCDNFGYYKVINPRHRCSADSSATTQWWIGAIAS